MIRRLAVVLALVLVGGVIPGIVGAQGITTDTSIFAPLAIQPAPSPTRRADGSPGPKYWQNRADYSIRASLDTARGSVQGSLTLRYTNRSPDVLRVLWLQTEQTGSLRGEPANTAATPNNDMLVSVTQQVQGGTHPLQYTRPGHPSLTQVTLAEPLMPGQTATLQLSWRFVLPVKKQPGPGRMGRDGALYEVAQWYPRMVVYDDVNGWNLDPYIGNGEFYLEYGDYTLEVTVPANYVVAATGTLDNPADVLTAAQRNRLVVAAHADTVVHVILRSELESGAARDIPTPPSGMVTWRFHARNVRDAVWCASPDYQWDATSWHGIVAQAFYRKGAEPTWRDAAVMTRLSIQEYSERWAPYPYPQMTSAEGRVGGMEYPMLVMVSANATAEQLYGVITHEVGHEWFPMVVGSNERIHAWQDEGVNTFINTFSEARAYPAAGGQETRATAYVQQIERRVVGGSERVMDRPVDLPKSEPGYQGYFKPAGVLQLLRRDIIGPDVFDQALKTYIARWSYKHPTPADFFRTMEQVSGKKLDWFWREGWYEAERFDQAVDSAVYTAATHRVAVTYTNRARGVLPLLVRLTFADGTTRDVSHPADVWRTGATYTSVYTVPAAVTRVELDPTRRLLDADRRNNVWSAQH